MGILHIGPNAVPTQVRGAVRVDAIDGQSYRSALADRDTAEALLLTTESQLRQSEARVRDLERRLDENRSLLHEAWDRISHLEDRLQIARTVDPLPF